MIFSYSGWAVSSAWVRKGGSALRAAQTSNDSSVPSKNRCASSSCSSGIATGVDLRGDYYDVLERLVGEPIGYAAMSTEAVAADPVVAEALTVPVGAPLLRMERVVHLADGRPVDFGVGRLRGDRVRLSNIQRRRSARTAPLEAVRGRAGARSNR